MSNLTLKLLRSRGIITGMVLPFSKPSRAREHIQRNPDKMLLVVPEHPNNGTHWAMSAEDGQRMLAAGYQEDEVAHGIRALEARDPGGAPS